MGGYEAEILELVPNERIVFRWFFVGPERVIDEGTESRLSVLLAPAADGGTALTLIHDNLEGLADAIPYIADNVEAGWCPAPWIASGMRSRDRSHDRALRQRPPGRVGRPRRRGRLVRIQRGPRAYVRCAERAGNDDPRGVPEGRVVGAIQVQSDGLIQAHVSMLLIDEKWLGRGIGLRLLSEGLLRAGGLRLDIRTRTEGYYERMGASSSLGFRLTRKDLGLPEYPQRAN